MKRIMKSVLLFLAGLFLLSVAGYLGYVIVNQQQGAVIAAERPRDPIITIALVKSGKAAKSILSSKDILWTEADSAAGKTEFDFLTRDYFQQSKQDKFLVLRTQNAGAALRKTDIVMADDPDFMEKALRENHRLLALSEQNILGGFHHLRSGNLLSVHFSPDIPHAASGIMLSPSARVISRGKSPVPEGAGNALKKVSLYLEIPVGDLDVVTRALALGKVSLILKPYQNGETDERSEKPSQEILALLSKKQEASKTKKVREWRQVSIHRRGEIQVEKRRVNNRGRQADE